MTGPRPARQDKIGHEQQGRGMCTSVLEVLDEEGKRANLGGKDGLIQDRVMILMVVWWLRGSGQQN